VIMATPVNYVSFGDNPANDRGDTIADYQTACRQVADHYGLIYVPLKQLEADPANWEQDFWDGIHPNLEGAAKISQDLIAVLKQYQ
jgi:lysophospholipase L1-like esterase